MVWHRRDALVALVALAGRAGADRSSDPVAAGPEPSRGRNLFREGRRLRQPRRRLYFGNTDTNNSTYSPTAPLPTFAPTEDSGSSGPPRSSGSSLASTAHAMSPTEIRYITSICLATTAMLLHWLPYPRYYWVATRPSDQSRLSTPLYFRIPLRLTLFFCCMVFPAFFGVFAYLFPLSLLSDWQYCAGDATTQPSGCESAEDAGGAPFSFVFGPTVLMWVFDAIGCHIIGFIKRDDSVRRRSSILLDRYGLTLLYCGLICFAGSFKVRIDLEAEQYSDSDAKLGFAERQKRAGIVSIVLAIILRSVSLMMRRQKEGDSPDDQTTASSSTSPGGASNWQRARLDIPIAHADIGPESLAERLRKYHKLLRQNATCEKKLKEAAENPGLRVFEEAVTASDLAAFIHVRLFTNVTKRGMFPEKGSRADAMAGKNCLVAMAFACKDQPVILLEPRA